MRYPDIAEHSENGVDYPPVGKIYFVVSGSISRDCGRTWKDLISLCDNPVDERGPSWESMGVIHSCGKNLYRVRHIGHGKLRKIRD